jgi:hypothetical protein
VVETADGERSNCDRSMCVEDRPGASNLDTETLARKC